MISNQQKRIIHQYARIAGIPDQAYRGILRLHSGFRSCADPAFSQANFDHVMAALEEEIELQAMSGAIPDPVASGSIGRIDHWRARLRPGPTTRQRWRIDKLRAELALTHDYCLGIVEHATGSRPASWSSLTEQDAAALIDALSDRMRHA